MNDTDALAELVDRKVECLTQLRDLGRHQDQMIADGSMGDLLKLLAIKQRLLTTLSKVERGLDPYRNQDPESRAWRSAEERSRCATASRRCEALLAEVVDQETRSERFLRERRDVVVAQLQTLHAAERARGAYAEEAGPQLSQLDLASEG